MRIKSNYSPKTLGPRAAHMVVTLHERGKALFTLAEVVDVMGLKENSARSFIRNLVGRGIATRLRPGLFILTPFELGREREYLGNPYVVAGGLAGGQGYFLSHASAMDIHGMVTQPQLMVYATSSAAIRGRTILGTEFRFVRCKPSDFFGMVEHWIEKREKVLVSDLERTVIDGLKQPEYCGGLTEVAKGLWMRRTEMAARKLVDYALRLGVGAVIRRLGYLLETYTIGAAEDIEPLSAQLTESYSLLDPLLPPEGKFLSRWRLRLNIGSEEILAVVRT